MFHPDFWTIVLLVITGLAGGFLAGMLGVGGGLVFIPVFREIAVLHANEADQVPYILANSFLIVMCVGISGTIKQYKNKNTDMKAAGVTGVSAILSSLTVTWIIRRTGVANQGLFNMVFAAMLILTGYRMWSDRHRDTNKQNAAESLPALPAFIPAGFIAGIASAISGLGGGIIMVPYFNRIMKLSLKYATSLSLSVIPFISAPLVTFYLLHAPQSQISEVQTGYIIWPVAIPMLIAAFIAAPAGVNAAKKMRPLLLLYIFLIFIAINLIRMLFSS